MHTLMGGNWNILILNFVMKWKSQMLTFSFLLRCYRYWMVLAVCTSLKISLSQQYLKYKSIYFKKHYKERRSQTILNYFKNNCPPYFNNEFLVGWVHCPFHYFVGVINYVWYKIVIDFGKMLSYQLIVFFQSCFVSTVFHRELGIKGNTYVK